MTDDQFKREVRDEIAADIARGKDGIKSKLQIPRLQLRWKASTIKPEYKWECHYELVIPIGEHDIRRENYDDEGNITKGPCEVVIPMKPPSLRDGNHAPCTSVMRGERYCDMPFRDGAHAQWDSETLGGLPIYVIAPDGMTFLVDKQNLNMGDSVNDQRPMPC